MVVPVSMIGSIVMFSIGGVIGHIGPRLPTLYMTRAKGFNVHFPPHPHPIPLSPYLTQRVLHMRSFYWSSMVLAIITLIFGAVSLKWGSAPFGFGLWVATSWMVLSRLQNAVAVRGLHGRERLPMVFKKSWTKRLPVTLAAMMLSLFGCPAK